MLRSFKGRALGRVFADRASSSGLRRCARARVGSCAGRGALALHRHRRATRRLCRRRHAGRTRSLPGKPRQRRALPRPRPTGPRARAGTKRHRPERGSRRRRRHGRYRQRTRGGAARVVPRPPLRGRRYAGSASGAHRPARRRRGRAAERRRLSLREPARLLPPRVVRRAYRHRRSVRLRGPARARFLHGEHRATVQGGARPPRGIRHRSRAIRRERRRAHRCRLPALRRRRHRLGQRLVEQRAGARRPRRRVR